MGVLNGPDFLQDLSEPQLDDPTPARPGRASWKLPWEAGGPAVGHMKKGPWRSQDPGSCSATALVSKVGIPAFQSYCSQLTVSSYWGAVGSLWFTNARGPGPVTPCPGSHAAEAAAHRRVTCLCLRVPCAAPPTPHFCLEPCAQPRGPQVAEPVTGSTPCLRLVGSDHT